MQGNEQVEPDDDDDFTNFGYEIPKCAGYLMQRLDACSNCRFGTGDPEGCYYCKLYVKGISTRGPIWQCHFVSVNANGKCRHYKSRKKHYDLGGCVGMDEMDLVFGRSSKNDGED